MYTRNKIIKINFVYCSINKENKKKVMKVFRITTKVKSTKTIQYVVEANSKKEAKELIFSGVEADDGEQIGEEVDYKSEKIIGVKFIEDLEE